MTLSLEILVPWGCYPPSHLHHDPRFVGRRKETDSGLQGQWVGEAHIVFVGMGGACQPKVRET